MWITGLRGYKEVPCLIGVDGGTPKGLPALQTRDYVNMNSGIYVWEGEGYNLENEWASEALGSDGITAMMVRDMNKDGKSEILANYTNDYLVWGQFFKIFEP